MRTCWRIPGAQDHKTLSGRDKLWPTTEGRAQHPATRNVSFTGCAKCWHQLSSSSLSLARAGSEVRRCITCLGWHQRRCPWEMNTKWKSGIWIQPWKNNTKKKKKNTHARMLLHARTNNSTETFVATNRGKKWTEAINCWAHKEHTYVRDSQPQAHPAANSSAGTSFIHLCEM